MSNYLYIFFISNILNNLNISNWFVMKVCDNCKKIVKIQYYIFLEKSVAKFCKQCHNAYKLQEHKQNELEAEPAPVPIIFTGIKRSYEELDESHKYGFVPLKTLMIDDIFKYEKV